jgi:hypothetical protein
MEAEFQSKPPHRHWWLELYFTTEEALQADLLAGKLGEAGWEAGPSVPRWQSGSSLGNRHDAHTLILDREGTGIFGMQTPEEAKAFLAQAREELRRHGLARVPKRKLTWQELM